MSKPLPLKDATGLGFEVDGADVDTRWGSTREEGRPGERVLVADLFTRTTFLSKKFYELKLSFLQEK